MFIKFSSFGEMNIITKANWLKEREKWRKEKQESRKKEKEKLKDFAMTAMIEDMAWMAYLPDPTDDGNELILFSDDVGRGSEKCYSAQDTDPARDSPSSQSSHSSPLPSVPLKTDAFAVYMIDDRQIPITFSAHKAQ